MKKRTLKLISMLSMAMLLLSAMLLVGAASSPALADSSDDFVIENGVLLEYKGKGGDVVIPDGVIRIGDRAFSDCYDLKSVKIPNGVTQIGDNAFLECDNLKRIEMPDSLTSIGYGAFWGCTCLKNISIPSRVNHIGDCAFYFCYSLESIEIPNSLTSIGEYTFGNSGLTSIEIPNSVTSIGYRAFEYCYSLASVKIASGVTSIDEGAFSYCENLTSIEIPSSVTHMGNYVFDESGLEYITLYDTLTDIGDELFIDTPLDCEGRHEGMVTLYVRNLDEIFPVEQYCIDEELIYKKVLYGSDVPPVDTSSDFVIEDGVLIGYRGKGGDVVIPDGVTEIGAYMNWRYDDDEYDVETRNNHIKSVKIPSSVTEIGERAFSGCGSLKSIDIPSSVTIIGDWAFESCDGLTAVEVPSSITSIARGMYAFCENLTSVKIPSNITEIGGYAFTECIGLKNIEIPSSVTYIGSTAFGECSNLTDVSLYDTVGNTVEQFNNAFDAATPGLNFTIYVRSMDFECTAEKYCKQYNIPYKKVLYGDGGQTAISTDGKFQQNSYTMTVGSKLDVGASATVTNAELTRVEVKLYDTDTVLASKEISGTSWEGMLTLDGSVAPLNQPGTYTIRLYLTLNTGATIGERETATLVVQEASAEPNEPTPTPTAATPTPTAPTATPIAPAQFAITAPTDGQTVQANQPLNITWTKAEGAAAYVVYYKYEKWTDVNEMATLTANDTSFTLDAGHIMALPGQGDKLTIGVRAENGAQPSQAIAEDQVTVTVVDTAPTPNGNSVEFAITAPTDGQTVPANQPLNITWTKAEGAAAYVVYYKYEKWTDVNEMATLTANDTSFTLDAGHIMALPGQGDKLTIGVRAENGAQPSQAIAEDQVTVTVVDTAPTPGQATPDASIFITQPQDQYVVVGQKATFDVEVTGDHMIYQWYINRKRGRSWEKIDGAVGTSYTTSAVDLDCDGFQYYCEVTDQYSNIYQSNVATLHVTTAPVLPATGDRATPILWLIMTTFGALGILLIKKLGRSK